MPLIIKHFKITRKAKRRNHFIYRLSCGHTVETFADYKKGEMIRCLSCVPPFSLN